ncbi:protein HIGH ARSENIC CONTENT 1, mitochondrial-like [Oryza brachyantha]|uniref:protein HIGH ARSENIC CONTENT 1, mitochondrial-like n=1 Tax=Oryza brachyantha TaxID=4533 RepID=UPI0007767F89|nr:protein HIGH ARSENIC CONTENT 1, mitochondrial-like [Oryza brachyantha]
MAPPYETSSTGSESPVPEAVVTVDVTAASELIISAGHRYVDVRTEEEMSKGHLHNSLNVPFMFFTPQGREKNPLFVEQFSSLVSKEEHVVVGCQSGKRSEQACVDLLEAGFKNVKNMGGGYAAWLGSGFPVNNLTL